MSGDLAVSNGSAEQKRTNYFVVIIFATMILWALALFAFIAFRPIMVLPKISLGPGYALVDQQGEMFTHEDLRGSIVLYNFTYTGCAAPVCRETSSVMQEVAARLDEVDTFGIPVQMVTISVDPERDSPEVLQAFAQQLGAEPESWHFLTGDANRLKWAVGGGFSVYYNEKEDGVIALDPALMLLDSVGILRAEYRTARPDVDIILRDIRLIAEEVQNRQGVGNVAYDAAHLFLCYPR
ncbi:MAG: SCO family protein [Chloroflexota bacterium]